MLKLQRLEIFGFKSFCEKTEVVFNGDGVVAVVGPNGCGKSNIADAISWVLGEQSAKSLRGQRMEDVIFNGTGQRSPLGLAEVSMTLVDPEVIKQAAWHRGGNGHGSLPSSQNANESALPADDPMELQTADANLNEEAVAEKHHGPRKKLPPVKPGEVVVTRRLYRSGDSDYEMNGRPCRLRDIQDLFRGTGLGPDSYAIIEQGRVGQILSSKPTDRRALIEEAAGTTKYKARKKLAEAKLEAAKQNLARVNDILDEVSKQLASLKRQASKARRFTELQQEWKSTLGHILATKLVLLDARIREKQDALAQVNREYGASTAAVHRLEREQKETQLKTFSLEDRLKSLNENLAQSNLEIDRARNKIQFNQQQVADLDRRGEALALQVAQVESQLEKLNVEVAEKQQADSEIASELARLQEEMQREHRHQQEVLSHITATEERLVQLRAELIETVQKLATLHNQLAQVSDVFTKLSAQRERLERERRAASEEVRTAEAQRRELQGQLASEQEKCQRLNREAEATEQQLQETKRGDEENTQQLEKARQQWAEATARQKSLEEILSRHDYFAESTKKLLHENWSADNGFKPLGVLADFIEVDSRYENAIEEFLKDDLECIVVETVSEAEKGIRFLRQNGGGRATFLLNKENERRSATIEEEKRGFAEIAREAGVIAAVEQLVTFHATVQGTAETVLPQLRGAFLVQSFERAHALAEKYPRHFFLTCEGDVFRGRLVRGGKKTSTGPLTLKRELRALNQAVHEQQKLIQQCEERAQVFKKQAEDLEAKRQTIQTQTVELEKELLSCDHRLKQVESDFERGQQRERVVAAELARLQSEWEEAERNRRQWAQEIQAATESQTQVEGELGSQQGNLSSLKASLDSFAARRSELHSTLAALGERRAASAQALARAFELQEECQQRATQLRSQREQLGTQQVAAQQEMEMLEKALGKNEQLKRQSEQAIADAEKEKENARVRLTSIEEELQGLRAKVDTLVNERQNFEVGLAKLDSDLHYVEQACREELNQDTQALLNAHSEPMTEEQLVAAEEEHHQLKARLDSMGPINMMALEEYAECEQRFQFLTTQQKDLLDSIQDTTEAIQEIDAVSHQQFQAAFDAINENFQESFQLLFGGGTGAMRLTEEENFAESGIDLVAQPPGKRLQNVLLLSGGEKALTAIALLLAIFRYQPSPFCILDEVDAPLDEANVERFARMVGALSHDTQFILITHNKKTMEIAHAMYGVTMEEAGVSKLVSVKFQETAAAPLALARAAGAR